MKLKTETNTPEMEAEVLDAAVWTLQRSTERLTADFEHGQWWVTDLDTGAQWSVCDTNNGFDFEQVTQGTEEL